MTRSHALRGNAVLAALRPSAGTGRRGASKTAFPRGAWERVSPPCFAPGQRSPGCRFTSLFCVDAPVTTAKGCLLQNGSSSSSQSQVGSGGGGSRSLWRSFVSDSHCEARSGRAVATVSSVSAKRSRTGSMSASASDESELCRSSRRLPKSRLSWSMCRCALGGRGFAVGSAAQADDQLGEVTADAEHADSQRHVGGVFHGEAARPDGAGTVLAGTWNPSRPDARVRTTRRRNAG